MYLLTALLVTCLPQKWQDESDRCTPKHDIGQLPQNIYKNRYIDVFPG